ncbi:putative RING-H2 finger protein ATL54-like [Capsicum annuum]|nr:putative RING-H2 finger protein ATL54-like [Capsicum annuum]
MGRRKLEIKKIQDKNCRQVTFCKRRKGLMKKANELSILCDVDVGVVIISNKGTGRLHEFSNTNRFTDLFMLVEVLDEKTSLLALKVVVLVLNMVIGRVVSNGVGIVVVHKVIVGVFVAMDSVWLFVSSKLPSNSSPRIHIKIHSSSDWSGVDVDVEASIVN